MIFNTLVPKAQNTTELREYYAEYPKVTQILI